jgi:type I restriction enzyme S subunit
LIENNRRRIEVLEESARLLYKEWFVHFRFPGHEHVKVIDGIPEGWERRHLEELVSSSRPITYGVVKPGPEDQNGITFVRGGDIAAGAIAEEALRTITFEVSEQYKRTKLKGGELLVSLVGNPGEVALVSPKLAGANIARQVGLIAVPDAVVAMFLRHHLCSSKGRADLFVFQKGSVQQVINLSDLKRLAVLIPDRSLLEVAVGYLGALEQQQQVLTLLFPILPESCAARPVRDLRG